MAQSHMQGVSRLPGIDEFNLAISIASLALDMVSLFIVICAAFGGWFLTSNTIKSTKRLSGLRKMVVGIFLVSAGSIAIGAVQMLERAAAALQLAQEAVIRHGDTPAAELLLLVYNSDSISITIGAFGMTLLLTSLLILFVKVPDGADKASSDAGYRQ